MKTASKYGEEWQKNADSLAEKHAKALEYLGDRWLMKGGHYTTKVEVLKNAGKNTQ